LAAAHCSLVLLLPCWPSCCEQLEEHANVLLLLLLLLCWPSCFEQHK
jgi:hypothetical protein